MSNMTMKTTVNQLVNISPFYLLMHTKYYPSFSLMCISVCVYVAHNLIILHGEICIYNGRAMKERGTQTLKKVYYFR